MKTYQGTGRRKTSAARVFMRPGTGTISVNGRTLESYFPNAVLRMVVNQPLVLGELNGKFDLVVTVAGATLVPKPGRTALVGVDLRDYLIEQRITAMSCVPTLLATIEEDVPHLRFILVSGEACPQDLIARWWRPDRRFLNVYGPTEATVTAT